MELRTARLRLRPYEAADLETLFGQPVLDPVVVPFWHVFATPGLDAPLAGVR
ncbi:MAG: hypothetical protein M0T75_05050 [Chloroflexi bacterium]|nr:hypothetical protein [Chloroflexota bacterium]